VVASPLPGMAYPSDLSLELKQLNLLSLYLFFNFLP
jgi:hypothetical protein